MTLNAVGLVSNFHVMVITYSCLFDEWLKKLSTSICLCWIPFYGNYILVKMIVREYKIFSLCFLFNFLSS